MDRWQTIETVLEQALAYGEGDGAPPRLADAIRHAVFPGGARVRPRLCLAVARACGASEPRLALGAAAALELLHCASLVHDDMPCFDDAALRRGRPSVQAAYGPALALLAGDALIVLAFETLARLGDGQAALARTIGLVAAAAGMPGGIVAGQGWECEKLADLGAYQRAKTASLFSAAAMAGAAAAGGAATPWRLFGERLGEAYQVADDVRDATAAPEEMGKPAGQDAALGRPSAVATLGLEGALAYLASLVAGANAAIPPCTDPEGLRRLVVAEMRRLLPREMALAA